MSGTAMEPGQGGTAPLPASYDMSEVGDWIALLKPRVMSLVVFSGLVGLLVAPGALAMHPVMAVSAILCVAVAAPRQWGWHALHPRWAEHLVADADVPAHAIVVDVGAGTGALTQPLVATGARFRRPLRREVRLYVLADQVVRGDPVPHLRAADALAVEVFDLEAQRVNGVRQPLPVDS